MGSGDEYENRLIHSFKVEIIEHTNDQLHVRIQHYTARPTRQDHEDLDTEIRRRENEMTLAHEQAKHHEQTTFFGRMRDLQVDLTRYLVAHYPKTRTN